MQKIGIVGGGISGLSTAFYILRQNPKANVLLFEGGSVGGWINTSNSNGYITENGPRSFRISERAIPLLRMCQEIGLTDKLIYSTTSRDDAEIYDGSKLIKLLPNGKFKFLKLFMFYPKYRRFILSNFITQKDLILAPDDDLTIRELMQNAFNYKKEEDQDFFIDVLTDAFVQGVYSGDISQLSARFCYPFSVVYDKYVLGIKKNDISSFSSEFSDVVNQVLHQAKQQKSSAMNFKGGMSLLTETLYNHLQNYPGFKHVPLHAKSIEETAQNCSITTDSETFDLTHIVSTVPSPVLAALTKSSLPPLSSLCLQIPHKSLKTVSLGFDSLPLSGVGFLVPSKFQNGLSGVLYDSSSFPYLSPSVSLMGSAESSDEDLIADFRRITSCQSPIIHKKVSLCLNGLPQYLKGHNMLIYKAETMQPKWLSVSGQSFYLSGVPNCVNRARELVLNNEKFL